MKREVLISFLTKSEAHNKETLEMEFFHEPVSKDRHRFLRRELNRTFLTKISKNS